MRSITPEPGRYVERTISEVSFDLNLGIKASEHLSIDDIDTLLERMAERIEFLMTTPQLVNGQYDHTLSEEKARLVSQMRILELVLEHKHRTYIHRLPNYPN